MPGALGTLDNPKTFLRGWAGGSAMAGSRKEGGLAWGAGTGLMFQGQRQPLPASLEKRKGGEWREHVPAVPGC